MASRTRKDARAKRPADAERCRRVREALEDEVVSMIEAHPFGAEVVERRERVAALLYQIGRVPNRPEPEVEDELAEQGLVLRPRRGAR